jgi:predicted Zn-dependent protease
LPGGLLYLNLGLLKAVETEAELAGVIAHLIGHVAARHSTEASSKRQIINIDQGPASMVVFSERPSVGKDDAPIGFLQFSRNAETEADLLGVQYAWASGYDPNAMLKFLEKVEKLEEDGARQAKIFCAHPPAAERIAKIKDLIARFPKQERAITSAEDFNRLKARLPQVR